MGANIMDIPAGTHTVCLGFGDMNGIWRGKRIPAQHWETICKNGNAFSLAVLVMDMTSDVWETPIANMANGYPDFHVFPMTQPVASPWEPGVAISMGRAEGMDHKPVPVDPRHALLMQVERAEKLGLDIQVGAELEFYLLDPETMKPKTGGISLYGMHKASQVEHVLSPIRRHLCDIGIPIEQSNPEYAPGQAEVNMRYCSAMDAADRTIMFRGLIKEIADQHGMYATFMAKPFIDLSGSGFHTHHSVWRDGKNIFSDNGKLNDVGMSYLAGMQSRMVESSLTTSMTPNAYRRRQPNSFCPTSASWGYDNRTTGLRVIEGKDSAVRIEKRDASADCNPYYLLAAEIAAGLDGMEQNLQPTSPTIGNAYEDESAEPLPSSLDVALEHAKGSSFLKEVLGEYRLELIVQQSEREIGFLTEQVTQVETDRYLSNF
jgi:glutamine synthetase